MVKLTISRVILLAVIFSLCLTMGGQVAARAAPLTPTQADGVQAAGAPSVTWTGRWIWAATDTANQWVAFRKTFTLGSVPSSVVTQIASDTKYWLYVNGTLVTFEGGLKRGPNPNDSYYDEKDLASYLQTGTNTVAILVWHFGKSGFSHKDSGAAGLLYQSSVLVSDTSWKALVHPGYGSNSAGGQPNYRLPESNIYYDARNAGAMANWQNASFNDSAWPVAIDKGAAGAAPWNNLIKRPTPFLRFTGLQNYTNQASLPTTGSDAGPISATLPSNLQVTVYLKVNAPAGVTIGVQTDHYTDGGDTNVRATYITTSGTQEFEELAWMSGTAVQYTIPSSVQIISLQYRESGYNTTFAGNFSSNDAFFNTLWQKSVRTVYLNARDNFMDCPTRERAQWWGDAVNEQAVGFYAFDPSFDALGNKAIGELTNWQRSDNTLYSPVPSGNWNQELPVQMLASIWSFYTYYLYTGDSSVVASTYGRVKAYMNIWTLDSQGLVNHRAGNWDWEDWGSNIDSRVLDNSWYYLALGTTIQLANLSGNSGDVAGWQSKRNSIATNFNNVLWNSTNNEYRSPGYTGDTDDRANALAVIAGLADASKYGALINVLKSHLNASPWMEFYVLEALYQMNAPSAAQTRMKARYSAEVSDPGYTVWELWSKGGGGTDNHGWAAGPAFALAAYATGVRPTQPGYSSYSVTPQMGDFTSLNTTVPTVKGTITVALNQASATHFTMSVGSPGATTAKIGVPNNGLSSVTIKANGTTVYTNGSSTGSVSGLSYAGSDANYVYFTVAAGSWSFDETGTAPSVSSFEAEASVNTLSGQAAATSCAGCSGSQRVGWVGNTTGNTLQFNNVNVASAGSYKLTVYYTNGDTITRTANLSVNGGSAVTVGGFTPTADANTVNTVTTTINLNAGNNTLKFFNNTYWAPDFDRITLAPLGNLALNRTVTTNSPYENGDWGVSRLTDGIETSVAGAKGYTSAAFGSADVSANPIYVDVDLGANQTFDQVKLFPRTDTSAAGGGTANFPVDFTIQVATDGSGSYTTVKTVTGQGNPNGAVQVYTFTATTARHIRIVVTRLGTPANDETSNYRLQLAELELYNA